MRKTLVQREINKKICPSIGKSQGSVGARGSFAHEAICNIDNY